MLTTVLDLGYSEDDLTSRSEPVIDLISDLLS
jgi:hypothetical protein